MKVKLNGNNFYEVTSPFGVTDSIHTTPHTGLDLAMNIGTPLNSPVDGIISKVVDYGSNNIGKGIIIETDSHERVIMGHLSDIRVSEGQSIHEGDFIALSGNTGFSTAGHLHLGLKNENGSFINPEKLINNKSEGGGAIDTAQSFGSFLKEWKDEGSFFQAMYDKSFFEVIKDFIWQLILDIYNFVVTNGEMFFILPAVIIMFATFIIGKNKFTKWIIPLWVAYFISVILVALHCLPPQ